MSINQIIVTTDSFHSKNKYDIVSSNVHYVTKLFQNNLHEDQISEDALKSYYVDYYLSHITHGGFQNFITNFQTQHKILHYIHAGLEALDATKHLNLFNQAFSTEKNKVRKYKKLDMKFKSIQKKEDLLSVNHNWLMKHPHLLIMNREYIDKKIEQHIDQHEEDERHVKVIKALCDIAGEEFICITAGDKNNIYTRSWRFKTTKGYYYTIEKHDRVTMYDAYTKEEVVRGRLIGENAPSLLSKLLS